MNRGKKTKSNLPLLFCFTSCGLFVLPAWAAGAGGAARAGCFDPPGATTAGCEGLLLSLEGPVFSCGIGAKPRNNWKIWEIIQDIDNITN